MHDVVECESALCGPPRGSTQARPRLAENGLRVCVVCRDKLAAHLREIPALYRQCGRILVNRYERGPERIRGGMPGGISLNDAVFTARADMLSVLASWCGLVVDERPVSHPPRREIDALARFLSIHLEWLTGHPAAGSAVTEIHDVAVEAATAVDPDPSMRLELGPCARAGCVSTVHMIVRARTSESNARVSCGAGHVWRPYEWLRLGHRIEQARQTLTDGRVE